MTEGPYKKESQWVGRVEKKNDEGAGCRSGTGDLNQRSWFYGLLQEEKKSKKKMKGEKEKRSG